jgi:nucleoside-diphosphate-sugar epimerase
MDPGWTIIGCGYVGTRLARRLLSQGAPLRATRRSDEACAELGKILIGARIERFDLSTESELRVDDSSLVVLSSPPGPGSPGDEERFAASLPDSVRLLYISTTGVYAAGAGKEVSDTHTLAPASARGQARLDVEAAIGRVHENSVFLRVPGIYGPNRGVHHRMLAGNYRLIGRADTLVGRIHVDDLVSALILLGSAPRLEHREYIIGDDEPTSGREHALGVAEVLQLPEPPTVDPTTVSQAIRDMLSADRRIIARRLHALSWKPAYPSWREGLQQALEEEGRSVD